MARLQKGLVNNITWFIFQLKEVLLHCLTAHDRFFLSGVESNIGYRNKGGIAYVRRGHVIIKRFSQFFSLLLVEKASILYFVITGNKQY